jgi:hypothetical protein
MVGIVQLTPPEGGIKKIQCYVYDSPQGPMAKIFLLSLQSVIEVSINIIHHMNLSIKGKCGPLMFWSDNKSLEQICKDIVTQEDEATNTRVTWLHEDRRYDLHHR